LGKGPKESSVSRKKKKSRFDLRGSAGVSKKETLRWPGRQCGTKKPKYQKKGRVGACEILNTRLIKKEKKREKNTSCMGVRKGGDQFHSLSKIRFKKKKPRLKTPSTNKKKSEKKD